MRIEGSQGLPSGSSTVPSSGGRTTTARAWRSWAATSPTSSQPSKPPGSQSNIDEQFRDLMFSHACESLYGDPTYGGNRDGVAWTAIGFAGDVAAARLDRRRGDQPVRTP